MQRPPTIAGFSRNCVCTVVVVLSTVLLIPSLVFGGFKLDSREYKLALDPAKFDFKNPEKTVDEFLAQQLKGIIGEQRLKGHFDKPKERQTVFRDTAQCALNAVGYSVRERTKIKDGKLQSDSRGMTLKFRTPDVLIASEAVPNEGDPKFEEDIAPLLIRTIDAVGVEKGAFARPPSMRSIFSVSLKEDDIDHGAEFNTIADVAKLFKDLKARLERAGGADIDLGAALTKGPIFHELVFEGPKIVFGENLKAEIDLSLWYHDGKFKTEAPALAELSFKYDVANDGAMGETARRALALFKALQARLDGWTSPDRETKTSAALPASCP